jgi:hypothetical protein
MSRALISEIPSSFEFFFLGAKARPVRMVYSLATICEPFV